MASSQIGEYIDNIISNKEPQRRFFFLFKFVMTEIKSIKCTLQKEQTFGHRDKKETKIMLTKQFLCLFSFVRRGNNGPDDIIRYINILWDILNRPYDSNRSEWRRCVYECNYFLWICWKICHWNFITTVFPLFFLLCFGFVMFERFLGSNLSTSKTNRWTDKVREKKLHNFVLKMVKQLCEWALCVFFSIAIHKREKYSNVLFVMRWKKAKAN